jgi:hypothetical protein
LHRAGALMLSKPEFDQILDAAVDKAVAEQREAEAEFAEQEGSSSEHKDVKTHKGARNLATARCFRAERSND